MIVAVKNQNHDDIFFFCKFVRFSTCSVQIRGLKKRLERQSRLIVFSVPWSVFFKVCVQQYARCRALFSLDSTSYIFGLPPSLPGLSLFVRSVGSSLLAHSSHSATLCWARCPSASYIHLRSIHWLSSYTRLYWSRIVHRRRFLCASSFNRDTYTWN